MKDVNVANAMADRPLKIDINGKLNKKYSDEVAIGMFRVGEEEVVKKIEVRTPEIKHERVWEAAQIALEAARPKEIRSVVKPAKVMEAFRPKGVIALAAIPYNLVDFKPGMRGAVVIDTLSETIVAPVGAMPAAFTLIQKIAINKKGMPEPVLSTKIDLLPERENEPAKRRPREPAPNMRLDAWKKNSVIFAVKKARKDKKR